MFGSNQARLPETHSGDRGNTFGGQGLPTHTAADAESLSSDPSGVQIAAPVFQTNLETVADRYVDVKVRSVVGTHHELQHAFDSITFYYADGAGAAEHEHHVRIVSSCGRCPYICRYMKG